MSPEQRRGEEVDARTDLYALGCILQEMSGPKKIVQRCLEPDRNLRYHSAGDLALDLRAVDHPRRYGGWLVAAAIVTITIATVLLIRWPVAAHHEVRSILVVPFENATHDSNVEYLSDGIAEGLIDSLAGLPDLRVVARTTAFRFKGKPLDLAEVRKQLDVDAVLSGRLVSAGNTIVVQADLVDAARGTELWGNRFHEQSANVLDVEQSMIARISEALRGRLARVPAPATANPEAYKLYLEGVFYWNKRNPTAIAEARDLFQRAVAIDPRFALAYTGLANTNNMLGSTYEAIPREEGDHLAREAVETALRLDPNLAEAHASLGLLHENRFEWASGERELKRALELNPNYTNALNWYSLLVFGRGQVEASTALMRKAVQLDPLSSIMVTNLAMRLNAAGKYDEALVWSLKAVELDPGYNPAYGRVAEAYEGLGDAQRAAAYYQRAAQVRGSPGSGEAFLVRAYLLLHNRAEAIKSLSILKERVARGEAMHTYLGWAYSAVGDRDRALEELDRAFDLREPPLRDSLRSPELKELKGDPRYDDLLGRLARGFD